MKTRVVPICEQCGSEILADADGVIVQGNIYSMDHTKPPIVGGAFARIPDVMPPVPGVDGEGEPMGRHGLDFLKLVEQSAFHVRCLVKALGVVVTTHRGGPALVRGPSAAGPWEPSGGDPGQGPQEEAGLIDEPGVPSPGDSVRLRETHPDYARYVGKALSVGRVREVEKDFVLYSPDGQPILAPAQTVVRVRQSA